MIQSALWIGLAAFNQLGQAESIITDDTYFYGQSEPVYPTRKLHPIPDQ